MDNSPTPDTQIRKDKMRLTVTNIYPAFQKKSEQETHGLNRISRSILDFANMMEIFQKYRVEFVSSTEKFDTSTPIGNMGGRIPYGYRLTSTVIDNVRT